jgi:outer membrane protein OmpA-like peptidoglycan-associated protein
MKKIDKKTIFTLLATAVVITAVAAAHARENAEERTREGQALQNKFSWWPTDATPGPVKDEARGGYWWWPTRPGPSSGKAWGNRGYCYVRKIIYDYKEEELPPPKPMEMRPALLVRNMIKNVKIYFDYNKADIRNDARSVLDDAIRDLKKNRDADILITGNCDIRGSEKYNEKLGHARGEAVKGYMLDNGVDGSRIKIISRGKLDAVAPVSDLTGMQKDRNAQFMIAVVEEVSLPYEGKVPEDAEIIEEGKYLEKKTEELEGEVKVSTREYVVRQGDSLWKIAKKELGNGYRWKYLYELNKDRIKNPNKLRAGTKILIPVE